MPEPTSAVTNNLVKSIARDLEKYGRRGDTLLAHITQREVGLLKAHGGAGTRNPITGLLEFDGGEGGLSTASVDIARVAPLARPRLTPPPRP